VTAAPGRIVVVGASLAGLRAAEELRYRASPV
jgi:monoamine oxidase